jgi:predicted esterase
LSDIKDNVAFLELVYSQLIKQVDQDLVTINVLGFSQGTATVCRWLANGKSKVNNLILWGGGIPNDLDFKTAVPILNSLNLKLVVGRKDEFIKEDDIKEHQGFLNEHFIQFELIRYDGGHQLDSLTLLGMNLK